MTAGNRSYSLWILLLFSFSHRNNSLKARSKMALAANLMGQCHQAATIHTDTFSN